MFGFFKRKKDDEDPLSDLKTVSRWMQELPAGDIYSAQEQVVQSLIQFNHAGLGMSKERLQVLMHLDEHARDMQFSLCGQYLRNPRMSKVIESRLWTAIHAFYWEITRGYHAFLMDFVANPGGSKIQSTVPVITARAIRGFADIFKWRYFRYEKVEDKLWLRLHNLFRISEFDGFQNNSFKLYPNDPKPASCSEEYIQALLLSPLGAGSLTPKQIEMVDHWLDNWSERTSLETLYNPERHHFHVDTAKGQGLKHIRDQGESSWRYLATDNVLEHLRQIERALKSGAAPVTLGLGEEFRLPDGYDLLEYVANEWSPSNERERRGGDRQPAQGRWEVMRDLINICTRMRSENDIAAGRTMKQTLTPEEILDIKLYGFVTERTKTVYQQQQKASENRDFTIERWPLHDKSESGLGIILRNDESEWVKVGKLLAMRMDPGDSWHIAVVRRLTRLDGDMRKIGLQVFNAQPMLAQLEQETQEITYTVHDGSYNAQTTTLALIFPELDNGNQIIVESSRYAHGRTYRMITPTEERYIRLEAVRDKGDGWLLATYVTVG